MSSKLKIKTLLSRKFNRWVKTIDDEVLRQDVAAGSIITGGAITSLLLDEDVNDYDIYFNSYDLAFRIADYYRNKYQTTFNTTHKVELVKYGQESLSDPKIENLGTPNDPDYGRPYFKIASVGIVTVTDEPPKKYEFFEQYAGDEDASAAADYVHSISIKHKNAKPGFEHSERYVPLCFTENAITISDNIQLILRFAGNPETVHKNFDFIHCQCWWQSWNGKLELPQKALESIITRELKYTGSLFPIASIFRIRKFIRRGWTINAGQILKMIMQCQDLNLYDVQTLKLQLMGVDVAYFMELIQKLEEGKKDPDIEINTYITHLIDEIFEAE